MKHFFIFIGTVFLLLTSHNTFSQISSESFDKDSIEKFRVALDKEYAGIVTDEDRKDFKGLEYYPIDKKYFVVAKLVRTPGETPFEMVTTTSRRPLYKKYGELHFVLAGKNCRLNVYQYLELLKDPVYKNYLFLGYKDLTSGKETYGGGKFIDLQIPVSGDSLVVDFNKSYNPYCAYNHSRSCPIAPGENKLNVAVRAGVRYRTKYPINNSIVEAPFEMYAPNILLPEIEAENLKGEKISTDQLKGKIIVVNFWATWCGPCIREFGIFEKIIGRYKDKVNFLMLSDESLREIATFRANNKYTLNFVRSKLSLGKMGLSFIPATYFYNSKGEYITKHLGSITQKRLESIVGQMLDIPKRN